ncbi:MAG: hypothetical protein K6C40_05660 [Thermoguttaceae bacterium]|nr:hypothetical protein [Thermoguttaceae bacterium]
MSSTNRADDLKRLYTELKRKFTPTVPAERTVLEHFIYATCLEDATYEAADAAFNALVNTMSGWNEVRVSSVAELAELMPQLPDPRVTGDRIRKILHAVFEEKYSFDIDDIRKKNLKEAYEKLESIPGGTPFSINYTAQVALGRHGIPVGIGEKRLLYVLGILKLEDVDEREVAGLNRAITKSQGLEFASLLHQLAAAFVVNPEARKIISFLHAFAPDFRSRMPRRREPRVENPMETPKPVEIKETPSKRNIMQLLINDPDFRKEREKDLRLDRDEYSEKDEKKAKEAYIEEMSKKTPLFDEAAAVKNAARKAKKAAQKAKKAAQNEKKAAMAEEKSAGEVKAPKAEEKPAKTEVKAPKAEEKPAKTAAKTPKAEEKPAKGVVKAPKAEEKTAKVEAKAPKAEEKPAKAEKKPAKAEVKPTKSEAKPSKAEEKPAKSEKKPAKAEAKPAKKEVKPVKAEEKPVKSGKKPAKTEAKPAKKEVKPTKAEEKPAKSEKKPVKPEVKPAKSEKKAAKPEVKPAKTGAKPVKTVEKPAKSEKKPAKTEKPAVKKSEKKKK